MERPLFITGIGTGIGKTLVAAIVTEALKADYWKPVQAGFSEGTDRQWVQDHISNEHSLFHPEKYILKLPASPHIAAREEGKKIVLEEILAARPKTRHPLIIEGAGGLLVPLNEREFVADLALALKARLILVSRNYLGSINHSLMTAEVCKSRGLDILGWIFNDQYGHYESEISGWTGLPVIASIPFTEQVNREFVKQQAEKIRSSLTSLL
jgi:dethiobiotin synthetase